MAVLDIRNGCDGFVMTYRYHIHHFSSFQCAHTTKILTSQITILFFRQPLAATALAPSAPSGRSDPSRLTRCTQPAPGSGCRRRSAARRSPGSWQPTWTSASQASPLGLLPLRRFFLSLLRSPFSYRRSTVALLLLHDRRSCNHRVSRQVARRIVTPSSKIAAVNRLKVTCAFLNFSFPFSFSLVWSYFLLFTLLFSFFTKLCEIHG